MATENKIFYNSYVFLQGKYLAMNKYTLLKYCAFCLTMLSSLSMSATVKAHEVQEKTLAAKHIQLRQRYDACMKQSAGTALAQKKCRMAYAKQRSFTPEKLYHWHMEHALEADSLYKDALIALKGTVHRVGKTMLGVPEIVMALDDYGMHGVRVEFSKQFQEQVTALQAGQMVQIIGICKGMEAEGFVRVIHGEFME